MTVVTEAGVRKIIRKMLLEEFRTSSTVDLSQTRQGCNLDGLDRTSLAKWYAKNFIYNPKISDESTQRRAFFSFLRGSKAYDLDPAQAAQYDKLVDDELRKSPSAADKYVAALEILIETIMGPWAALTCRILARMFPAGSAITAATAVVFDESNLEQNYRALMDNAEEAFRSDMGINSRLNFYPDCYFVLFPRTLISYLGGNSPEENLRVLRDENEEVSDILSRRKTLIGELLHLRLQRAVPGSTHLIGIADFCKKLDASSPPPPVQEDQFKTYSKLVNTPQLHSSE